MNNDTGQENLPQDNNPSNSLQSLIGNKKVIIIVLVILFMLLLAIFMVRSKSSNEEPVSIQPRPLTNEGGTISVPADSPAVQPQINKKSGILAYIKEGDIYQGDLANTTLLLKNNPPASRKLSFSPAGNFLTWITKTDENHLSPLVSVHNLKNKSTVYLEPVVGGKGDIIDYAWSPDEKNVATLKKDYRFAIAVWPNKPGSASVTQIQRKEEIQQLVYLDNNTLIFSGSDGISSIDIPTGNIKQLLNSDKIQYISLSPDRKKLYYSIGDEKQVRSYILHFEEEDNTESIIVPPQLQNEISLFPLALWYPDSRKLLLSFRTRENSIGVYDFSQKTLQVLSPFDLGFGDSLIDDRTLLSENKIIKEGNSMGQIAVYTLDSGKVNPVTAIEGASSPAILK